ncbi:Golgin candidate 5 [Ranunculus cassubicifolius]
MLRRDIDDLQKRYHSKSDFSVICQTPSMNERLSQTLSRVAVLEAQVSCLRAEQTQLTRSLEKERQRASENRQEYLAAQESVASYEVRVNQLEGEIKELRKKNKQELQELMAHNDLLQQVFFFSLYYFIYIFSTCYNFKTYFFYIRR